MNKTKSTNNNSSINKNPNEPGMSSSIMSEKVDKRHMANFSSGNQKNIKVSFKLF